MITTAKKDDVVEVSRFLVDEFHQEYSDWYPEVDVAMVIRYIGDHYNNGRIFINKDKGKISGVTMAKPANYWFSRRQFLSEGVFYVAPRARRGKVAKKLLNELTAYARELDLDLTVAVSTGDRVQAKDRFFESNGLTRAGGLYVLRRANSNSS